MECKDCGGLKKIRAKGLCSRCYHAAWRKTNPEKARAQQATYYKSNSEKILARKHTHYKANPEKFRIRAAAYYKSNSEKILTCTAGWRKANPELVRTLSAAWRAANPEKRQASVVARKARKLQATPHWADKALIQDMYAEAGYQQMHVDHIVPLRSKRVCGLHWEGNLQLLPPTDNISKGNRHWPDM